MPWTEMPIATFSAIGIFCMADVLSPVASASADEGLCRRSPPQPWREQYPDEGRFAHSPLGPPSGPCAQRRWATSHGSTGTCRHIGRVGRRRWSSSASRFRFTRYRDHVDKGRCRHASSRTAPRSAGGSRELRAGAGAPGPGPWRACRPLCGSTQPEGGRRRR